MTHSFPTRRASDLAAIETGAIADAAKVPAIGLYQRNHEAGRDALCVIPARDGDYRFGMEASFGEGQSCAGKGSARRAGDKLILSRSEEHTPELQSLMRISYAVLCLKKKTNY